MLIEDPDVWRAAILMVERHGPDAGRNCARQAERLLEAGDPEGFFAWERVTDAVAEIQRVERARGEFEN